MILTIRATVKLTACRLILILFNVHTLNSYRLKQELEELMKDECRSYHDHLGKFTLKFHEPPTQPNCIAWLGGKLMFNGTAQPYLCLATYMFNKVMGNFLLIGCIFGCSDVAVMERAVTRDRFKETKILPNWTSCDPSQREHLRVVPTRKLLPSAPTPVYSRSTVSTQSSKS